MKKGITNGIMLIAYPNCLGNRLTDLDYVLQTYYDHAISGIHILPFYPSSGDRGFAPITYDAVDSSFGDWSDIKKLSDRYYLMFDYMINHLSVQSSIFQDYLSKHDKSKYRDFFIKWNSFWGGEPTEEEYKKLYRRKATPPFVTAHFDDGSAEKIWCTFSEEQLDIDCLHSREAQAYLAKQLKRLASHGASLIRTDAMAYAAKRKGENCFFVEPEMWTLIDQCKSALEGTDVEILPEIHENYFFQKKLEEHGVWTYDFQLPFLILNAVWFGKTLYLKNWLKICPRKQFTTLDTHDGIGVVDARYLMPDEEVMQTKQRVFDANPEINELYRNRKVEVSFSVFDAYQINCTYYDALGGEDERYLLARAVQFFAPGIPQVYYMGLFAGRNDFALYYQTMNPRDVNRHYYALNDIYAETKKPVAQKMKRLMTLRNTHAAFRGQFMLLGSDGHTLRIRWENGVSYAELNADFQSLSYQIRYTEDGNELLFA